MVVTETVGPYTVSLIQKPGGDFYESFLIVRKDELPQSTRLMIDCDDAKWRNPKVIRRAGIIYFCDGNNPQDAQARIDTQKMTVFAGISGEMKLDSLQFMGGWK